MVLTIYNFTWFFHQNHQIKLLKLPIEQIIGVTNVNIRTLILNRETSGMDKKTLG